MNSACPNCLSTKAGATTPCDGCMMPVHLTCVGLSGDDIRVTRKKSRNIKIICNACNLYMGELGEIKNLIKTLKDEFSNRFASLEAKLETFSEVTNKNENSSKIFEEAVVEAAERMKRSRNIIIKGLPEHEGAVKQCIEQDTIKVIEVLRHNSTRR